VATWRFQPSWWAVCGVVAGVACLSTLGLWQVHRGQDKQALLDQYAASTQAPTRPLDTKAEITTITHVKVSGRYEGSRQLLLDNQSHQQRPGYQIWTPLRLDSGALILVNRGWVPLTQRAHPPELPVPQGMQQLTGYWQSLPKAGMQAAPAPCAKATVYPLIVNYPTATDLACLFGEPVESGQLLLDADLPHGYVRAWTFDNGFPPSRHYGYALQWFALAATLLIIFLKLNLQRNKPHE
jgi:surfeit locus 1 family protein